MAQSANPAARGVRYTRTMSTSSQNASVWSLTAATPTFFMCCVQIRLLKVIVTALICKKNIQSVEIQLQQSITVSRETFEYFVETLEIAAIWLCFVSSVSPSIIIMRNC